MELLGDTDTAPPPKRLRESTPEVRPNELAITGVIAVADLGRPLDLKQMERLFKERKTGPIDFRFADKFQGAILKKQLAEGLVTGTVFSSGRIVCTGAKTENAARSAASEMLHIIKQITYPNKAANALPTSEPPKIQGYIGAYDVGFDVQLEMFALEHPEDTVYEPEIYSCLIYKPKSVKATLYISPKGRVQISAASQDLMSDAQKALRPILPRFQGSKFGHGGRS